MKTLKKFGIGLVALFLIFLTIGFLLPSEVHVEKSVMIDAPIDLVYEQVNDLRNWEKWSPYKKMDPLLEMSFSNPPTGAKAYYKWQSELPELGNGRLTITEATPNERIVTAVAMEDWGDARGEFTFTPKKGDVEVTWAMDANMGKNPFTKFGGLFMRSAMKKQFKDGLDAMKKTVEGRK